MGWPLFFAAAGIVRISPLFFPVIGLTLTSFLATGVTILIFFTSYSLVHYKVHAKQGCRLIGFVFLKKSQ